MFVRFTGFKESQSNTRLRGQILDSTGTRIIATVDIGWMDMQSLGFIHPSDLNDFLKADVKENV